MGAKARIETEFTGNDASFMAAAQRVEKRGQTLQHRVERLFARDPGRRGEVAFIGLARSLASGDIIGGIEGITSRISGIGLIAGVAVGASIAIFAKFKGQIDETNKSAQELGRQLAVPRGTVAGLGEGGIQSFIQSTTKGLDDLAAKRDSMGVRVHDFFTQQTGPLLFGSKNNIGKSTQTEIDSGAKRIGESFKDLAGAGKNLVDIREELLNGSETQAKLLEVEAKKTQELAKIDKERLDYKLELFSQKVSPGVRDKLIGANEQSAISRSANVTRLAELDRGEVQKRSELKERELSLEERILLLGTSTLATDEKRLGVIRERIDFLKQEMTGENDPIKKHALGNQLLGAEQDQRNLQMEYYFDPKKREAAQKEAELKARQNKEFDRTGGLLSPHFGMNNELLGGTDPMTGMNVDLGNRDAWSNGTFGQKVGMRGEPTSTEAQAALTRADMDAIMQKYWGGN